MMTRCARYICIAIWLPAPSSTGCRPSWLLPGSISARGRSSLRNKPLPPRFPRKSRTKASRWIPTARRKTKQLLQRRNRRPRSISGFAREVDVMAEVTAALVKELREKTGAGMMDCKRALGDSGGDIEAAVDWLRKKGLSAAAKKAGRVAAEGLIGVATRGSVGAVVEVNSETDFVARNDAFQSFVRAVSRLALDGDGELAALKEAEFQGAGRTVEEELTHLISTIGENLVLRRVARLSTEHGAVHSYVHNTLGPGLGKIGVIVTLASAAAADQLATLG